MRTSIARAMVFVIFGMLILATPARSADFTVDPAFPDRPSSFLHFFSCYDIRTRALLDCSIRMLVTGLVDPNNIFNNGGHVDFEHPDGRPLFDDPTGLTCVNCTASADNDPRFLQTSTNNTVVAVLYPLPQVSGVIEVQTSVDPPPRFFCVTDCLIVNRLDVRVPGLEPLPQRTSADNDDYVTFRNVTESHPEGHWGTRATLDALREIAEEYKLLTTGPMNPQGRLLSINDISLPAGGLFDFNATWAPPHDTHRTGSDADINRVGVDCLDDDNLIDAVATIRDNGRPGVRLQCYEDGRKHIDFN